MRIDPHVHFRDEEQNYKETIVHGLQVAKKNGVDIVFDMPNLARPLLLEADVKRRLALVPEKEKNRYYLYLGATENEEQLAEAVRLVHTYKEVIGLKMYAGKSTGDLAILKEEAQRNVYTLLAKYNYDGVIAVHCEKEAYMTNTFDPEYPLSHALARPNKAETESIKDQIRFVKESGFRGTLHIAHLSCKDSLTLVDTARKQGMKITCGVTPHHLMWTMDVMNEAHGLLYKMNPPLRSQADVEGLRAGLKTGLIDWIETDHAPHTIGEKLHDGYPSGYPTLYIYKECVETLMPQWGVTTKQIEALTYTNIVKTFKLN